VLLRIGLGLGLGLGLGGCKIHQLAGGQATGTCDGACKHYVDCKPGHPHGDFERCEQECPSVLGDSDARSEFERLSCEDALEFVDGRRSAMAGGGAQR
jgi:hypothetical protein